MIQRYRFVEPDVYRRMPTEFDERPSFLSTEKPTAKLTGKKGKATVKVGQKKLEHKKPELKVAEDDSLAIHTASLEPKEFYATAAVVKTANQRLDAVGSPIELKPRHEQDRGSFALRGLINYLVHSPAFTVR